MLAPIFTLDYEIHGNGEGCPHALMVEPTNRMLDLFDEYGAKLTILADVAEILKFKEYFLDVGRDDFYSQEIERQLQDAVSRGHDVQLHIHSSYFGAKYESGRWIQNWSEYDFAKLPIDRMDWMVMRGKEYLESLLQPISPDYRCNVFRAANWSVSPSRNVVQTLIKNGIQIDSSVFKYGQRNGHVQFDYSNAFSELLPWPANAEDICKKDDKSPLWEFPIYTEKRHIGAFATPNRVRRAIIGRLHSLSDIPEPSISDNASKASPLAGSFSKLVDRHAWKADFNQCTGWQLVSAINRAESQFNNPSTLLPFVLIGHSKLFSQYNSWSLRPLLLHVKKHPCRFQFGKFSDFRLSKNCI